MFHELFHAVRARERIGHYRAGLPRLTDAAEPVLQTRRHKDPEHRHVYVARVGDDVTGIAPKHHRSAFLHGIDIAFDFDLAATLMDEYQLVVGLMAVLPHETAGRKHLDTGGKRIVGGILAMQLERNVPARGQRLPQ